MVEGQVDRSGRQKGEGTAEWLRLACGLLVCTAGPAVVSRLVGPWSGLLASLAALPVWIYLGPPPMPGFLNGVVSLTGGAAIGGVVLACLGRAVLTLTI